MRRSLPLAGVHAFGLDDGRGGRRGQKVDEGLRRLPLRLLSAATAAVKTSSCCSSGGNGPASSTPGAIKTLTRNTPSSASPLATAGAIWAGVGLRPGLGLHRLGNAEPFEHLQDIGPGRTLRHEGDRIAPQAASVFNASGVPTSGLGAPARTMTP